MSHGCPAEALCKCLLLFPADTFIIRCHPCPPRLSPSPHPSIHHTYPSLSPFPPCSGSFYLYVSLFSRWQRSHVFLGFFFLSFWFCIVSLSLVSRQWFYPMVGDIMLFYHRVEPRTGCWRVSASIRQSIPTSFHTAQTRGGAGGVLGSGEGACGVAAGGSSISLTCICLSVLFIFFSSTMCTDPSLYVLLIYLCVRSWLNV